MHSLVNQRVKVKAQDNTCLRPRMKPHSSRALNGKPSPNPRQQSRETLLKKENPLRFIHVSPSSHLHSNKSSFLSYRVLRQRVTPTEAQCRHQGEYDSFSIYRFVIITIILITHPAHFQSMFPSFGSLGRWCWHITWRARCASGDAWMLPSSASRRLGPNTQHPLH
ncbi:hypothetical protein EX30DRAFT_221087 [Ascodesmis nigricans]|uniref:Uncharacterized protein n=1 Tax=Ascodesmis nigricans TaxID=341454 RepID=A0A4S2N022_9PEZI|nr:hypothetical protein EX30DRAFT_221087 [Ascodesmis nigricans]